MPWPTPLSPQAIRSIMRFGASFTFVLFCACAIASAADVPRANISTGVLVNDNVQGDGVSLPSAPPGGVWLFGVLAYTPITTLYAYSVELTYPSGSKITSKHTIPLTFNSSLVPHTRTWAQVIEARNSHPVAAVQAIPCGAFEH